VNHGTLNDDVSAGMDGAARVTVQRLDAFTDNDRAVLRALSHAVYPPDAGGEWSGRHLEWATPTWCVCVQAPDGTLASFIGIVLRRATCDGAPLHIGGIGGVMTHPALRRRGFAGLGMRRAVEFFHAQEDVAFGLLVCDTHRLGYYGSLGWQEFTGELHVLQHGQPALFTYNRVMTIGVKSTAPLAGCIDLLGPPW